MLQHLNLCDIKDFLYEISNNGDMYGYDDEYYQQDGYYQEYKELFNELSYNAYSLYEAMSEVFVVEENWNDMVVGLLGNTHTVLGYDTLECDYYGMLSCEEDWGIEEAVKRIKRLSKDELIKCFKKVMTILVLFFDVKMAHDCLTVIVEELDERDAILKEKHNEINRLYEDLTGKNAEEFDRVIESIPERMWIE